MRHRKKLSAAAFSILIVLIIPSCTSALHPGFSTQEEQAEVVETVKQRVINGFPFFKDDYAAGAHFKTPVSEDESWPTKEAFHSELDKLLEDLPPEKEEFTKELAQLINTLGDGHTSLRVYYYGAYPGIQIRRYENDSGDVEYYIERLSEKRIQDDELHIGDIILAVTPLAADESSSARLDENTFTAETLADEAKKVIPASNTNSLDQFAANSIIAQSVFAYRDLTGQEDYEELEFRIKSSKEPVTVRKGEESEYFARSDQLPFGEHIGDNGKDYYYLRIPTMGYVDDIDRLDRLINAGMNSDGMILDLRRNSGGSSVVGDYLISRFGLTKNFKFSIVHGKTGDKIQDIGPVEARGEQYTGPVVLLIDHYVFSSANHFAALCHYANEQDIRDFIFVGDTTGGGSAIPKITKLAPDLELRLSRNLIVNPEGKHYERGIEPDVGIADILGDESKDEAALAIDGKRLFPCGQDRFQATRDDDLVLMKALEELSTWED